MNIVGIYKITSPTGKVYIGQSWHIKRRWNDHRRNLPGKHRRLHSSFISHGVEQHRFDILHTLPNDVTQNILNEYEQFYMDMFRDSGIQLLNIKEGGNGYGKHTEETKHIIKQKRSFQVVSDEQRKKTSIFFSTIKRTPEWVAKVAAKSRGRKRTDDQKRKLMKPIIQYSISGELIKKWDCSRIAAKELNTVESNICNCLTNRSKSAVGFKWVYA